MEVKTSLALLGLLWSFFCVTECVSGHETRRRRNQVCSEESRYRTTRGISCCLCPKGFYVQDDCTSDGSDPKCEVCESESYRDHANHERTCEPCTKCGTDNDNMMIVQRCTSSSNTVCQCQDNHYCDKGDECRVCYSCNTCDEFGIKVPCNRTHNTQCKQEETENTHRIMVAVIFAVLLLLLLLLAGIITVFLRKKKKFCFKSEERTETLVLNSLLDEGPDLKMFLPRIAETLGVNVVRNVVRREGGVSEAMIENIKESYPGKAEEQAFQLLQAWYESHGRTGAYGYLQRNLEAMRKKTLAGKVREIVGSGRSNGEVEENSPEMMENP